MSRTDHPRREAWLDSLKGFAILLVILGHVLSGYLDAAAFPGAYTSFYTIRTWIYSFHMPLFFLISGFTFTLAYWRGGRLRWKGYFSQLFNLLWIYILFAVLQWGVKQVVPNLVNETYDLEDLKRMFIEPLGNFWYIYVLFVLYVLGALTRVADWPSQWILFPGALSIVVADIHLDWTELTLYRIIYHFFFFALGSALCSRRRYLASDKCLGISAMVLAAAAYFYLFWYIRDWYANWKVAIAVATSFVFLAMFFRWKLLAKVSLLQLCGKYCLELYLLHTFFTAGLRSVLPLAGITRPWLSVWVNFIISTGVSLGLAWIAGKCRWMDLFFRPSRFLQWVRSKRPAAITK